MTMSKNNKAFVQKQSHVKKPYKFDLDVKGQHCSGIMNVRDTSFHGDRLMIQIWLANVKTNRSQGSDKKTCKTPNKFNLG